MDPRKTWVCSKRHRYTDFDKRYGEKIECPICYEEFVKAKTEECYREQEGNNGKID